MSRRFFDIAFTPSVQEAQQQAGSRTAYARVEGKSAEPDRVGEIEASFIAARDSFYMATVSETGWPYLQHRGGPDGFVKLLGPSTLGVADFRGNRQYISRGNLSQNNRAALFFMDYPNRRRLKLLTRVSIVDFSKRPDLGAALADAAYPASIERGLIFEVEAFDWNCPQHITPRFTADEIQPAMAKLKSRIKSLEDELAKLQSKKPI